MNKWLIGFISVNLMIGLFGIALPQLMSTDKIPFFAIIVILTSFLTMVGISIDCLMKNKWKKKMKMKPMSEREERVIAVTKKLFKITQEATFAELKALKGFNDSEKINLDLTLKTMLFKHTLDLFVEITPDFSKKDFIKRHVLEESDDEE